MIAAFIAVICCPYLWWGLLHNVVDSANHENRKLAERPHFDKNNYAVYPKEYESYFNDRIPFRNYLVALNNGIDYFLFGVSSTPTVVIGKDGWLFYKKVADGDQIGCYQGTNLYSEEDLKELVQNCLAMQAFLKKKGKEFVIFIAPNKTRIYSEKMPEQYGKPAEQYRAKQVVEYLKENTDIRVVYPYDELMKAKEILDEDLYYKTDTHWNLIGGYIGASALLAELGIDMPDITSKEISITQNGDGECGLAGALNLATALKSLNYEVNGYEKHNLQKVYDLKAWVFQAEEADKRKIYVLRDSFGTAMAQVISSQFNDSYWQHRNDYTYDDFAQQNPDIFVYETVERYVDSLRTFSITNTGKKN
jgi:hypothetical protein